MSVRSILLSGGNQGLGFSTASHLASTPNVLLFLGARKIESAKEAIKKFSLDTTSKVIPVQLDVTDKESITKAVESVKNGLEESGKKGLDVLINNAGIGQGSYEEIYAVNVFGVAALTNAVKPLLSEEQATIVNVSSTMGSSVFWDAEKNKSIFINYEYSTSKAALNGLTQVLAADEKLKKSNTRVVALCPGFNATALNGYAGTTDPMEGSKIIVEAALQKGGDSGVFYDRNGPIPW